MPRPATGQVVEYPRGDDIAYGLRFRAYGKRRHVTLGKRSEGWTRQSAERELGHVIADVERGRWQPPTPAGPVDVAPDPLFPDFAREWYLGRCGEWARGTQVSYEWQLNQHLVPFFAAHRLSDITIAEVDRYREVKVREDAIARESINKTITRLGQILDVAVERDLIPRNPVKVNPSNRKLKVSRPRPVWLDRADQLEALLKAAGELDREARRDRRGVARRAVVSTLLFAGLRVSELCGLRWRDVDLAAGRLHIRSSKTDAGVRTVELLPVLRDELLELRAGQKRVSMDAPVFPTSSGRPRDKDNVRERILRPVVTRANENLERAEEIPLPEGLTPHKLRHTFASLLVALGEDPRYVMGQLGHTDPAFTLRLYSHTMRREDGERDKLNAMVGRESVADPRQHLVPQSA